MVFQTSESQSPNEDSGAKKYVLDTVSRVDFRVSVQDDGEESAVGF